MAEKKVNPSEPTDKFMTVFRPELPVVKAAEENADKSPNDKLEEQRKAFEEFDKQQEEGKGVEADVEAKAKDMEEDFRLKAVKSGKSLSEVVEAGKDDDKAKEQIKEVAREQVQKEQKQVEAADKKKDDKAVPVPVKKPVEVKK